MLRMNLSVLSPLAALGLLGACSNSAEPGTAGPVGSGGTALSGGTSPGGSANGGSGGGGIAGKGGSGGNAPVSGGGGVVATGGASAGGGRAGDASIAGSANGGNAGGSGGDSAGGTPSPGGGGSGGRSNAGGSAGAGGAANNSGAGGQAGNSMGGAAGAGGGGGKAAGRCPEGPFPAPMVMSTKNVCQNFDFQHSWNEGPTWVASQGAFFFSNFVAGKGTGGNIIKYTPGGNCEVFIQNVGCNGLAVSNDGNLLAACHQTRAIERFDLTTKQKTTLATTYMNQNLDTPNDLIQHSNGSIYFTNPPNELDGRAQGVGPSLMRIEPDGTVQKISSGNFNGIGLSPDEKKLYVVRTEIWDLDEEGVPSNRQTMFQNNGDGLAVDCAGNVYVDGKIFGPNGQQVGSWGSGINLAFGGEDGKTVLVAGQGKALKELTVNVPGLP
jgi:gluconolactonase